MPSACVAGGALTALPFMNGVLGLLSADFQQVLQDALFYCSVREYIMDDIIQGSYRELVAANLAKALGFLSTVIVTLWVAYQGFQIISGTNRNPILPLMLKTGKIVLILSIVSLVAGNSPYIVDTVTDFKDLISIAVTDGADITTLIDLNLGISALLNSITESMKALDNGRDPNVVTTTVGLLGQSGPAMLTGVLLMLAELSITFAIMLSPLFIFFLLFQQTSAMFWSWAKFLIGAMFSMAALTVVGALALKATAVYGGSVVAAYYTNSGAGIGTLINGALGGPFDISGSSLRLAALGTLMSAIIISIPPTIMQFFSAGAGFAAGAFGFAGAGALAGALGQSKGLGGSTGIPGIAYGQNSGAGGSNGANTSALSNSGPAGGSANSNNQMALNAINRNAQGSGLDDGYASNVQPAGSAGLANQSYENPKLAQIHAKQGEGGGEFRAGGERQKAMANVADMDPDPDTGVYRSAESDAAMATNPKMGTGGTLAVAGFGTPTHMGSNRGVSQVAPRGQPSPVEVPYGKTPGQTRIP